MTSDRDNRFWILYMEFYWRSPISLKGNREENVFYACTACVRLRARDRGDEWSLRVFASMQALRFSASTSRDKKFALRAASSLESTTREQRALLIFSACSNPYGNPFPYGVLILSAPSSLKQVWVTPYRDLTNYSRVWCQMTSHFRFTSLHHARVRTNKKAKVTRRTTTYNHI